MIFVAAIKIFTEIASEEVIPCIPYWIIIFTT
jgi:hypothetical protein